MGHTSHLHACEYPTRLRVWRNTPPHALEACPTAKGARMRGACAHGAPVWLLPAACRRRAYSAPVSPGRFMTTFRCFSNTCRDRILVC